MVGEMFTELGFPLGSHWLLSQNSLWELMTATSPCIPTLKSHTALIFLWEWALPSPCRGEHPVEISVAGGSAFAQMERAGTSSQAAWMKVVPFTVNDAQLYARR